MSRIDAGIDFVTTDVDQLLREHGLQVTAQRMAILRAVSAHPHTTADQLADQVRSSIGSVSRQAVYDTLSVLVDKQLIRRIQPAGSAARYEDRVGDNHHHLICRGCGSMFDVDCAVGVVPCLTADDDHGFVIDEAEVIYWGHCPSCRSLGTPAGNGKHTRAQALGTSNTGPTTTSNRTSDTTSKSGRPARPKQ